MARSIMQEDRTACYICGRRYGLEEHHIFGGANRKWSEKYGLKVMLCQQHHNTPPDGVHFNKANMDALRAAGQRAFESKYNHALFMQTFGKNYLPEG